MVQEVRKICIDPTVPDHTKEKLYSIAKVLNIHTEIEGEPDKFNVVLDKVLSEVVNLVATSWRP